MKDRTKLFIAIGLMAVAIVFNFISRETKKPTLVVPKSLQMPKTVEVPPSQSEYCKRPNVVCKG